MQDTTNTVPNSPETGNTTLGGQTITPQPTVNATVASSVYPEPTKGFMGSVMQPLNNAPDVNNQANGGAMLLYVTAFTIAMSLVLSIVANVAGLLEVVFNHIGNTKDVSTSSYFGFDSYELKIMLWLVSSLIISTVLYIGLLLYLRKKESVELNSFSTKVYGFIYGAFLTILGLAAISSFGNLIYSCLVPLVPKGTYDSAGASWWAGILQALFTTALLVFVVFYYYKKATSSSRLS